MNLRVEPNTARPRVSFDGAIDGPRLTTVVRDRLAPALTSFLPSQRWYGDKGRTMTGTAVLDVAPCPAGEDWFALAVVEASFPDGGDVARYFVPLAVGRRSAQAADAIAVIEATDGDWLVTDAFREPAFPSWLLDQLAGGRDLRAAHGRFRWDPLPALAQHLAAARAGPMSLGTAEQSNTSVRFGDALFLKIFRKLRSGISPDEEIGRFLATKTAFRNLPLPLASGSYVDAGDTAHPLALAQCFVPSLGDGWSVTLRELAALPSADPVSPDDVTVHHRRLFEGSVVTIRRLGERTGELHLALASAPADPDFAPQPISAEDAAEWEDDLRAALGAVGDALGARAADLPAALRPRITDLTARLPALEQRAGGFHRLVGFPKTRVHGDYHLGQTLRTPGDDWIILDFEGEPARSIAERRARTSPLKDVAGMLRSFAYARGVALRALDGERDAESIGRLSAWEQEARAAFVEAYRRTVGAHESPLVPTDPAAFGAALVAWELDKAIYEVAYELNNRPDWLGLPLAALLAP